MPKNYLSKIWLLIAVIMLANFYLFSSPIFSFPRASAATAEDLKQQISDKENEIKDLENQINIFKERISNIQGEENTLKNQISLFTAEINNLNWNIKLTEAKIKKVGLQIEDLTSQIDDQTKSIENKKIVIASLFQSLQEYDNKSLLAVFLSNFSLSDILNQIQNTETLEAQIQDNINQLEQSQTDLKNQTLDLQNNKLELSNLSNDLQYNREIFQDKKVAKAGLLQQTKSQEDIYQKYLKDLQAERNKIQEDIYNLEDQLQYLFNPNSVPQKRPGILAWPLNGVITQGYGPTSQTGFINDSYKFHNGIDIAAAIGTEIKAADDGQIVGVGNLGKYAYGKWIAIKHDNGLTTLYGHLSKIIIRVGDTVSRNQVIGYEGDTGFATGPHLHFTVYASDTFKIEKRWYGDLPLGWSLNPMNYLGQ